MRKCNIHLKISDKLIKEKEELIKVGDYLKAEAVKQKINKLKSEEKSSLKRDVENRHSKEMKDLENQFIQELNELNLFWQAEYEKFEEQLSIAEKKLDEKHKNELEELKSIEENKLMKTFKHSKEYLDYKNSEIYLVKLEKFIEAHNIKQKAEALEKFEIEKHMKSIDEILKLKIENLLQKHNLEKNGYKQKLMCEYEELKKAKQIQTDKLIIKYKNKKLELDMRQKREVNLNENDNLLKANIYSSNLTNMSIINCTNNAQNKSFNKTSIKFSFENLNELKFNNLNLNSSLSGKKTIKNSPNLKEKQIIINESKTERKSSARLKISKHLNYETNYKNLNKHINIKKDQKITISEHLLKESDLDHKKPKSKLNRRSSQTRDSNFNSTYTKRILEFNDNINSDFKTNLESKGNFIVHFQSDSDNKQENIEVKNQIDSRCKETFNFLDEEFSKNINNINTFKDTIKNENEQNIKNFNLKNDILENKFE